MVSSSVLKEGGARIRLHGIWHLSGLQSIDRAMDWRKHDRRSQTAHRPRGRWTKRGILVRNPKEENGRKLGWRYWTDPFPTHYMRLVGLLEVGAPNTRPQDDRFTSRLGTLQATRGFVLVNKGCHGVECPLVQSCPFPAL